MTDLAEPTPAVDHPGLNLAALFEAVAARVPERECIVFGDRRWTYEDVQGRVHRLAHVLHGRGLGAHAADRSGLAGHESHMDHLAIYAYNGNEYLESMLAAFEARVAPVNVNYRYVANDLRHLLTSSGAKAIVFHSTFAPTLAEVLPDLPELTVLLQIADDSGNELLPGAEWYEEALASASSEVPGWSDAWSPDDLYVLYTGGTTGLPKGVLWRQADIHRSSMGGRDPGTKLAATDVAELADIAAGPRANVTCAAAPYMHGAGHWLALSTILQGSTVVIPAVVHRLDPADLCSMVDREQVTFLQIVGDAFGRPIIDELDRGDYDWSSLVIFLSGGAALSVGVKERFLERFPNLIIVDGLGSSEGGGQGIQVTMGAGSASTGTFTPTTGSVVVAEDLSGMLDADDHQVGWLAKRLDTPLGYLNDPEATARVFPVIAGERMSVPGDRARWGDGGVIELLGRDSATINSGGEKIFAEEIEATIVSHPAVADVIVVGRDSPRWGQEVVALVQFVDGRHAPDDVLAEHARQRLAHYKAPKAWLVVDQIRRSPAGKADLRWAKDIAAQSLAPSPTSEERQQP